VKIDRPPTFTRRRALQLIAAAAGTCFTDAALVEPGFLSVTRRDISCAKLPAGLDGLRIALLADFHFQPGNHDALLEKVLVAVRQEAPDLIALCGDFVNHDLRVLEPLLERLREMQARHGVFAVMGNHDGWAGTGTVIQRQFERAGISFLINQSSILSFRSGSPVRQSWRC
jgi:predicted MPP superfamily phosphohydrolase